MPQGQPPGCLSHPLMVPLQDHLNYTPTPEHSKDHRIVTSWLTRLGHSLTPPLRAPQPAPRHPLTKVGKSGPALKEQECSKETDMWTSNSWAGRYQLQESPRAGHSLERDSGESQGGSQGGKDWRLQASARVQQGTWESRPSPGKGTETDQHPQAATRDRRGCRPAVQPADEGQGSSGDHRAENALEFLPKSSASTAHTPSPAFCKPPAFTSSPFHWSSRGKAWRETRPSTPPRTLSPGSLCTQGAVGCVSALSALSASPRLAHYCCHPRFTEGQAGASGGTASRGGAPGQALGRPTPLTKAHAGRKPAAWAC